MTHPREVSRVEKLRRKAALPFRLLTGAARMLPSFIILGAQRGGTSTLYQLLIRHPQVQPALRKEIHFFDTQFEKGRRWYRAHFPLQPLLPRKRLPRADAEGKITGEASPYYLFHPHAPRRIAETVPRAKLIALLRNPVDRAYSHYRHEVRAGRELLSFEAAIAREPERLRGETEKMRADPSYQCYAHQRFSYLARGRYVDQLRAYHRHCGRSSVLVLKSEDLFSAAQRTYDRVLAFLGLPPFALRDVRPYNASLSSSRPRPAEEKLRAYFEPYNQALYAYLDAPWRW